MTEPNLDLARQWGEHLVSLPEAERKQAIAASRQAGMLSMSEEELEKIGKPQVSSLGAFLDAELPTPPILVEPFHVARGGITAMTARGGKGKTTLSFNRLLRWAAELPLFDDLPDVMAPTAALRSLIVENEGAGWHTQRMLRTMMAGIIPEDKREQVRENVHVWGDGGWSAMKFDARENVELLKRGLDATQPDILFLEPFRGLWKGEESSSTEMSQVFDVFHELANEFNCAILVTHHEKKGTLEAGQDPMDAARGSGVFSDLGGYVERLAPVGRSDEREWRTTKARWGPAAADVRMKYVDEKWGYEYVPEGETVRKVCEAMLLLGRGDEHPLALIAEELGETQEKTRKWLKKAYEADRVKRRSHDGRTWYRLAAPPDEDDDGAIGFS